MSEDYMKYDGSVPEPPYTTISDFMDQVAELEAQLAACAAGPWRFDVENAPKDVVLLVAHKYHSQGICRLTFATYEVEGPFPGQQDDYVWRERFEHDRQLSVFAFAVPNPPQVTT